MNTTQNLSQNEKTKLFSALKARFEKNPSRHTGASWSKIEVKLKKSPHE
jgi:hypothetical protein